MATTAPEALALIKEFEGYLKQIGGGKVAPYLCPARVPTIGWGSTFYEDRRKVTMADPPIDKERATALLAFEISRVCEPAVNQIPVPLHPLMHGALVSFAFNVGTGALKASTLRKRVIAQRWEDVPREFAKWNRGGGRTLAGLTRRRKAEAAMFMAGVAAMRRGNGGPPIVDDVPAAAPVAGAPTVSQWRELIRGAFGWWLRR